MKEIIRTERNKKILERLAEEFGENFLKINRNGGIIGLYGADENIINFFKKRLKDFFLSREKRIPIVVGNASYNIDVGFFLHIGYFEGINKY